jgi:hypothetical protein
LLAQELANTYNGVNSLCVHCDKETWWQKISPSLDYPSTLSKELDVIEEEWGDSEGNTLEYPYTAVEETDQDSCAGAGAGALEDSQGFPDDTPYRD